MAGVTLDWVGKELLASGPGVFLFTSSESHGMAIPFDVEKLREMDKVSVDVYDSKGNHVDGRKILTRDAVAAFAARYAGNYILLARLAPELVGVFERRYGNGD